MSTKQRIVAIVLCFFLGALGVHRFYLGRWKTGLLMIPLCFLGISGVWALVDLVLIIIGRLDRPVRATC